VRNNKPKYRLWNQLGFKLLLATVIATSLVFAWTSTHYRSDGKADTWVDPSGHLHVLGIVLGRSTLRQAETALKSRSDTALYIYPVGHPDAGMRLESFFPSIGDHSKVILVLEAKPEILHRFQELATIPHLYPNKVARMNLHPESLTAVQRLVVKQLTLIPSIQISKEMLAARFGPAPQINTDDAGGKHYLYPTIGLDAYIPENDAARLRFRNPADHSGVVP